MEKTKLMISKRLQMVTSLVTEGNVVADVGTDHGFVPLWLVLHKKVPRAIAMDVKPGPLQRAQEHIREYGLEAYIETRISDGLECLAPNEADSIIIAGMGGPLMIRILQDGQTVLETVKELILSPHTEVAEVRRYLQQAGWAVMEEHMVFDEGKYYVFLRAIHGRGDYNTEKDFVYGKRLMESKSPIFLDYISYCREKQWQVKERLLQQESETAKLRLREVEEKIAELEQIIGQWT
ncbi:MAG: tRNA (adenine(22)-N(1))-methyltransferase [Lachnospiraceae bacterium]